MAWATANSNLGLVKYWGKAAAGLNQPASASLSVTLDGLSSAAEVCFDPSLKADEIQGLPPGPAGHVREFLKVARSRFHVEQRARVRLLSNFPVAAGLASSASTFAALAVACAAEAGADLSVGDLAALARCGSGSACRSIPGGFVEWRPAKDGSEVRSIAGEDHWALEIVVAVVSETPKEVRSREGMIRTAATSPYYSSWIQTAEADLEEVRAAVRGRDLTRLGECAERNCLRMHAAAIASKPPLLYWQPATVAVMHRVWELRRWGTEVYFSIDAGPQVKILCAPGAGDVVSTAVASLPGVLRILRSRPGAGAKVLAGPPAWAESAGQRRGNGAERAV